MPKHYGKIMWVDEDFNALVDEISNTLTKKFKLKRKVSKTDVTKYIAEKIKKKGWLK